MKRNQVPQRIITVLLIVILISSCNPATNNDFSNLNPESVSQVENSSNINDVSANNICYASTMN